MGLVWFPENLPVILEGLGVQANYTLIDTEQNIPVQDHETGEVSEILTQPLLGVSDSSYSLVLAYEKELFGARLAYVWRDDFLNDYEAALFANPRGIYRQAESRLDLLINYNITDDLLVTLEGTNLTDEVTQSYYEYPDTHNVRSAFSGRTFALGARYSF